MWANPSWTNVPRHTTNFTYENVHLTHPCFELCRNNPEPITPHMCANPSWTNVPKTLRHTTKHKTQDPKIFISHIPVLNFAGTALHITPHMWANPSWTNVPRHTTNFRSEHFHLTHPCFELCRNSSPCYTTHVSQPILNQRPKTHYKLQIRTFSSHTSLFWTLSEQLAMLHHAFEPTHPVPTSQDTPQTTNESILQTHPHPTSQDTLLKISMFTVYAAKMSSLARRHGRMKTCVRPSSQKWFSVSFSGLNYLRPTYCKHALKRCSLGWSPLAS